MWAKFSDFDSIVSWINPRMRLQAALNGVLDVTQEFSKTDMALSQTVTSSVGESCLKIFFSLFEEENDFIVQQQWKRHPECRVLQCLGGLKGPIVEIGHFKTSLFQRHQPL